MNENKNNWRTENRYNYQDIVIVSSTFVAKQLLHDGETMVDLNVRKDTENRRLDFYFLKSENVLRRIEEQRLQKINYLHDQQNQDCKNSIKS